VIGFLDCHVKNLVSVLLVLRMKKNRDSINKKRRNSSAILNSKCHVPVSSVRFANHELLDRMADIDLHRICANLIDIAKEAGRIVVSAHPDSSTTSNKKNGSYIPVRLQRTDS
jgi:hypothetical protein